METGDVEIREIRKGAVMKRVRFKILRCALIFSFSVFIGLVGLFGQSRAVVSFKNVTDPATADVLGVRLYMTPKEAAAAIEKQFHIANSSPRCMGLPAGCNIIDTHWTPGHKYIAASTVQTPQFGLMLNFIESYPYDPSRPEILIGIQYFPVLRSQADKDAFAKRVIEKYGPDINEGKRGMNYWCTTGTILGIGKQCAPDVPGISLDGLTKAVELYDNGVRLREQSLWNASKTSAPPL